MDCVWDWAEWTECVGGSRARWNEVKVQSVGAGLQCPDEDTLKSWIEYEGINYFYI